MSEEGALREPVVQAGQHGAKMRGRLLSRPQAARWLRRLAIAAAIVVALPLALTFFYLIPWVRPISTPMLADLVTLQGYNRKWTPLEELGAAVPHAVMMSEDGQFCFHNGVDWGEMSGVIEDALSGESPRGASTIPMQTVKNLYLWLGRSYIRKGLELPLAIYFDLVMPKRRIMEIYLNVAEWGPHIYGAEAAAQHYFKRHAKQLSPRQAALLAVTLPNPTGRNPAHPSPGMSRLAATVQARAARAGAYDDCLE
jgi:monofunctional biosynthetic peptidoglycan transglycosylase